MVGSPASATITLMQVLHSAENPARWAREDGWSTHFAFGGGRPRTFGIPCLPLLANGRAGSNTSSIGYAYRDLHELGSTALARWAARLRIAT